MVKGVVVQFMNQAAEKNTFSVLYFLVRKSCNAVSKKKRLETHRILFQEEHVKIIESSR